MNSFRRGFHAAAVIVSLMAVLPAAEPVEVVARLCSAECSGRLAGTEGEWRAASFLKHQLGAIEAVSPPGWQDFIQPVVLADPLPGKGLNVGGWFPPKDENGETIILCAHYDHLGDGRVLRGASLPGEVGRLHPGADDNASGVAAVLEAARLLATDPRRELGVLVLFTTAEEAGCQGARAYAGEYRLRPAALAINMDQVGRLGSGGLAWEWAIGSDAPAAPDAPPPFLARAAEMTGVALKPGDGFSRRTDGAVLAAAGVPTLCFFTGTHEDVHRPTDTPDKLDFAGIQRIAALAALAVIEAQAELPAIKQ